MKGKCSNLITGFIRRMLIGLIVIVLVNGILEYQKVDVRVGVNPLVITTVGMLGIPGAALLYGIMYYEDFKSWEGFQSWKGFRFWKDFRSWEGLQDPQIF